MTGRYFTLNVIIRKNQIEAAHGLDIGEDETQLHSVETVSAFRQAVLEGWPEGKVTWALSWEALTDPSSRYQDIRRLVRGYRQAYGDDVTYFLGGYFANAYSPREKVRRELHLGLQKVREVMGIGPESVIAGFLSAQNMKWLAEEEGIHVCQGTIWSQFSIDNQDGEGSVCYPYYPSIQHFCKPAQSPSDQVDCVNLDGWTVDFLAARRPGFEGGFNSRMGIGPIETLGAFPPETAMEEIEAVTKTHFGQENLDRNGFGFLTVAWEIALVTQIGRLDCLTRWLRWMKDTWPDAQMLTEGGFGLLWRAHHKDNCGLRYHFVQQGTGIGGSDEDKQIKWFQTQAFRLALLKDLNTGEEQVIDFTRYDTDAKEPDGLTRHWSLMGDLNQKGTRPQDKPRSFRELPDEWQRLILQAVPELDKRRSE